MSSDGSGLKACKLITVSGMALKISGDSFRGGRELFFVDVLLVGLATATLVCWLVLDALFLACWCSMFCQWDKFTENISAELS